MKTNPVSHPHRPCAGRTRVSTLGSIRLAVVTLLLWFALGPVVGAAGPTPSEVTLTSAPGMVRVRQARDILQMGDRFRVGLFGQFGSNTLSRIQAEPAAKSGFQLYLDGVEMKGLSPTVLGPESFGALPAGDPNGSGPGVVLEYALVRNSRVEENRIAWDRFLSESTFDVRYVDVAIGFQGGIPHQANALDKGMAPLQFHVRPMPVIVAVIAGGIAVVLGLMHWAISGTMLRESGPNSAYSLGKTQMAFWGFTVAISFLGVWLMSHRMERIPSQVLVLLGISGATGLGSVVIGGGKRSTALGLLQAAEAKKQATQSRGNELAAEIARVEAEAKTAGTALPPERVARLAAARQELVSSVAETAGADEVITTQKSMAQASTSGGTWWIDIISDENGPSFHRLQVVLWTLILGVVYVERVSSILTMPEFETTLLTLMGISNGTYLGFKVPEK